MILLDSTLARELDFERRLVTLHPPAGWSVLRASAGANVSQ